MQGRDILLITLVMAIWGFNFSMIKLGVSGIDPLLIAAARFTCATFPIILFIPKPKVQWRYLMAYGLVFGTGIWGMASCSITFGLSSGMAAVLLQIDVITTILVGVLLYKEVITFRMAAGIFISAIGLTVSIVYTNGNITLLGLVFITIAAICWPFAAVIVRMSGTRSAFAFNIWGMLFAPLPLIALSIGINGWEVLITSYQQWDRNAWISVLFQAYPTTVFGYWVWNRMILKYPMSQLGPMTLLTTVFAVLSGYIIYNEQLTTAQWISCTTFLLGIALILAPTVKPQAQQNETSIQNS